MFTPKTAAEPTALDLAIDRLHTDMRENPTDSEEYAKLVDHLVKLHNLNEAEKPKGLSTDVKATIAANLAGIGMIIFHERANVIATKGLAFVQKLR